MILCIHWREYFLMEEHETMCCC